MNDNKNKNVLAWHFVGGALRDGRPVPDDGHWLQHDGELVLCKSGLHASICLIDALRYATGTTICRVECGGEMLHDNDKLVAMRRRILWRVDGEALLRSFARWCALQVAHLWNMPGVVRRYLETGDESIRADSRDATRAARDAARDTSWTAKGASLAARDATKDVRDAAWAAKDAAWAARDAIKDVRDASRDTSWDAQNEKLERMVEEERKRWITKLTN